MAEKSKFVGVVKEWWASFPPQSRSRGNIAGGLVLLENLKSNFDLDIESHKAERSDQLRNAGISHQRILARFDEHRVLVKEGGRTNRGLMTNLAKLLNVLAEAKLDRLSRRERDLELVAMQKFLAKKATERLNAAKISFVYSQGMTSRKVIGDILDSARKRGKAGDVAEHLVGAKLALRFPNYAIRNSAVSAADDQTNEHGDFQINDCVFHVTVSPNLGHYDKCLSNLAEGLRVYLLVPDITLVGTRQITNPMTEEKVSVESIESFVSQNVEELSDFSGGDISRNLGALLDLYNSRVAEVETDLSLQINVPSGLKK